jgi:hypothetical protein
MENGDPPKKKLNSSQRLTPIISKWKSNSPLTSSHPSSSKLSRKDIKETVITTEPSKRFWQGGFEAYYQKDTFADVELVIAESKRVFKVHRVVLARYKFIILFKCISLMRRLGIRSILRSFSLAGLLKRANVKSQFLILAAI